MLIDCDTLAVLQATKVFDVHWARRDRSERSPPARLLRARRAAVRASMVRSVRIWGLGDALPGWAARRRLGGGLLGLGLRAIGQG